ncbi:hypothetical protein UUR13_0098 [Ureaplasma urealyticum serovar 13 str. ATCC 33698]|nr:hypothetical protein UUR13_0098 [Ureaplasma urealyticum serovar 13 str. ATCC 33698]EDY74338.1 hypothetical protein UUR4_0609 [Ureaplasma urealyticum serovar 4 str. ATCC 27816]
MNSLLRIAHFFITDVLDVPKKAIFLILMQLFALKALK